MSEGKTGLGRHLSYANVMASAAVFIALGGSAYALSRGEVKTRHIDNRAVTAPKNANNSVIPRTIRTNAVRPRHVLNSSVGPAKIVPEAIRSFHIDLGAVGPRQLGPIDFRASDFEVIAPGETDNATATCDQGEQAISGGGWAGAGEGATLISSRMDGNGWTIWVRNEGSQELTDVFAEVYCLKAE